MGVISPPLFRSATTSLLLVLLLITGVALAEEVQVIASLDGDIIYQGESFNITITVDGPMRGSKAPELPDMEDFALMGTSSSTNYSFINGHSSSSKVYRYTMVPQKSGNLKFPAVPVKVKGKTYFTRPIQINVRPASGGAQGRTTAQAPANPPRQRDNSRSRSAPDSGNRQVFIRSWTEPTRIYVGQQLTHHFALYRDPQVRFLGTPQYTPPDLKGFWSESLGDEISGYQKVEGTNYAVTELRTALFPSESGKLTVGPATVRVRLRGSNSWGFFSFDSGPDKVLQTPSVEIEVIPLPTEGRPAGFSGTVAGSLSLDSHLERGPYEVGQPITLTVDLSGSGNPRAFSEPVLPQSEDFKYYDAELQSSTSVSESSIRVEKRFTRVVVPRREGELTLPGLTYSWFDPDKKRYRTGGTKDLTITVAPSSSEETNPVVFTDLTPERVELLGRDIHHIKTDPYLAGDGSRFPRSRSFWSALLIPWPILAGTWIRKRRREIRLADRAGTRARGAQKVAVKRLKDAESALSGGDLPLFCLQLNSCLREYLADRLDCSAAGLTSDTIEAGLQRVGSVDGTRRDTVQLMNDIDRSRYAPGSGSDEQMQELYRRARTLIETIEGEISSSRKRRSGPLSAILPMLVALGLLLSVPGAGSAANHHQQMEEAAGLYEQGDYEAAAKIWHELTVTGESDSHLWYNLGNARFHQRRIGTAILAYRRALRLAPRDQEIRDNLELARGRRLEPLNQAEPGSLKRPWFWLRARITPGELALSGLIVLWLGTILMVLGMLGRIGWQALRPWLIIVAVLLPALSIAAWRAEWEDWSGREAVLLAPTVAVQSGPGDDYITLFEIHEGSEIKLQERRGGWIRISVAEELEGWIPVGTVESL